MKNRILFLTIAVIINLFFPTYTVVTLINSPGVFPLGGGITANPTIPNDMIVMITASNVILDIHEYTLNQLSGNTMQNLTGIFLAPNISNVTIRNGTINGISGVGVYISDGCSQIYLENLSVLNCNQVGIQFDGSTTGSGIFDVSIKDCFIGNNTSITNDNVYGLRMIATNNAIISDCIVSNNLTSSASNGYGMSIESCTNCSFNNNKVYGNGGNLIGTGISLINSSGCSLSNCDATNNITHALLTTVTSCGFSITSCSEILVSYCKAVGNSSSLGTGIGYSSYNNLHIIFENSTATTNNGGILSAGFYLGGTETNFGVNNNISAVNSANSSDGSSYGILLDGAQSGLVSNNTFANNTGLTGYGLFDTTLNTDNFIMNNLSYNNTTTGYSVSFTEGQLPVIFATNSNFSSLNNANSYYNVSFVAP